MQQLLGLTSIGEWQKYSSGRSCSILKNLCYIQRETYGEDNCSFHHQDAIIWHCFNAQPQNNCQQIILCFGIYAKVPFKGSQSLIYWETKILCDYSVRNSRCCRAIIAIFMVSSNAKHYWISSRHPILMNCWKFYLQWAIITVIWWIELEFWDFVTITHCSIQL